MKQYETVIGLEVHVEAGLSHKDFLRMLHKIRRCAQHPHLPGLHRNARKPSGSQQTGGGICTGSWPCGKLRYQPALPF